MAQRKELSVIRGDVLWAAGTNLTALFTAVVIGLLMPRLVSYGTYAGYRTYTLYIGYIQLFHLGFVNGTALRFGAFDYNELPRERFRFYTRGLFLLQLLMQGILLFLYFAAAGGLDSPTPILFVILNLSLVNLQYYYMTVFRFSGRIREASFLLMLYEAALLSGYGWLLYRGCDSWSRFLLFTTGLNLLLLLVLMIRGRELTFGRAASGKEAAADFLESVRRGSFLMLGEFAGLLILGIDSIFAQLFFDDRAFSEYSFAVYIIAAAFTVINSADLVIFPYLKRLGEEDLPGRYRLFREGALHLSAVMLAGILFAVPLIRLWIPNYTGSIPILLILAGTLLFRALQGSVCGNFFRALDMERVYFRNNCAACLLALLTDTAALLLSGDLRWIAAASLFVYAVWFISCDLSLRRRLEIRENLRFSLEIAGIAAVFYFCAWNERMEGLPGILSYGAAALLYTLYGLRKWKKYAALREN